MQIIVKFFASCREIVGTSSIDVDLPEASTTLDLLVVLQRRFPNLQNVIDEVSIAVNKKYVKECVTLNFGDEVALIPPISGG